MQSSPVDAINVGYSRHLTEGDDQQRNGSGEAVEQSQPIFT